MTEGDLDELDVLEEDCDQHDRTETQLAPTPSFYRRLVTILLFFGLMQIYALRVLLSVAIIPIGHLHQYDNDRIGWILSSFFIGYMPPQAVGGYVADRFGALRLMGPSCCRFYWSFCWDAHFNRCLRVGKLSLCASPGRCMGSFIRAFSFHCRSL